jgi:hypothetical protein
LQSLLLHTYFGAGIYTVYIQHTSSTVMLLLLLLLLLLLEACC